MTKKKKRERVNYNEKNKHKYWFLDQNIKDLSGTNSTFCGFAIVFKQNSNIVIFAICILFCFFNPVFWRKKLQEESKVFRSDTDY